MRCPASRERLQRSAGRSSPWCCSTNGPSGCARPLAASFIAGSLLGLTGLFLGGELPRDQVVAGLVWMPFALLGYALSGPIRARVDAEVFRRYVLGFCVLASITVIVRATLA